MLRERVAEAFDRALRRLKLVASLAPVRATLAGYRDRLDEPMRVALIGRVSSGKSTLTNALLGSRLVATGIEELTYNVNWLRYAPEPSLLVHSKDGGPPRRHTLAELEKLTARREENRALLANVDYIEVFVPDEQLKIFDLIDTPGLDSHFDADSQNTLRFLDRTAAQVRDSTVAHARGADALLMVFGRSLAQPDEEALARLQGPELASLTPLTAIGVLTKIEHYWPAEADPMLRARQVADRLMQDGPARRLLYDVVPVCSLVGAAAQICDEEHLENLRLLAGVDPTRLGERVRRARFFCTRNYDDLPVSASARKDLFDLFGAWGIVLVTTLVRDGITNSAQLRTRLLELSGMAELRRLVHAHFGNRAYLIKLQRTVADIRDLAKKAQRSVVNDPEANTALTDVVAEFDQLILNEHSFAELAMLRHHYRGELRFSVEDTHELLRVTGEHGVWLTDRLGLDRRASVEEMYVRVRERLDHWSNEVNDPGLSGPTRAAARTLHRSYERLAFHIGEARRHLELAQ